MEILMRVCESPRGAFLITYSCITRMIPLSANLLALFPSAISDFHNPCEQMAACARGSAR